MPYTSRPYTGEADYEILRKFLVKNYELGGSPDYGTIGDLDWWRYTEDDPAMVLNSTRIWLDENGEVAGFAWPGEGEKPLDIFVFPQHKTLEAEMLAYSEGYLRNLAEDNSVSYNIMSYTRDASRNATLELSGYTRTGDFIFYWVYDLTTDIPEPTLPEGFRLSSVKESRVEAEQRVALHRAAFTASQLTGAKYQGVMSAPTYRSELDLLVVAPDGVLAAFALAWYDAANGIGMFDPVGCATAYQRRGLTKALMFGGLHKLKELGAKTAIVCSSGSDEAATRFYRSTGFKELDRNYTWEKELKK